ncbi:MAG: hypothetical protein AMJ77_02170 [Dehalococcoidia bacterium SM23_28_2]|nr:MAG: hypothetical protein AMJ77_02170 [Dehalococcoidia bacterium SM23_28_2]
MGPSNWKGNSGEGLGVDVGVSATVGEGLGSSPLSPQAAAITRVATRTARRATNAFILMT